MTPSGDAGCLGSLIPDRATVRARARIRGNLGEVMRVILDVMQGPLEGRQFVLDRPDSFIVGRSRFVHCPMPEDLALSRDHFMIELNPPTCELRDLGSTNGTFVNNQRVDRVRLSSQDLIAAGQSVFRVVVESADMVSSVEGPNLKSTCRTAVAGDADDPVCRLRRFRAGQA